MNKKVGIVSINWNNFKDTREFIHSILSISYKNYILIIVDNNSTDNSLEMLEDEFKEQVKNGKIIFIKSEINRGFASGNNLGIRYAIDAQCDLVLMINNDTVVSPDFLEPMIDRMYSSKNIGVVTGKIYYYDNKNLLWSIGGELNLLKASAKYYGTNVIDKGQFDKIEKLGVASGCFMLMDCSMLKKIGLLSEQYFFRGEEWEFSYRVRKNGYEIAFEPKARIYHKVSRSHNRFSYYDIYSAYRGKLIFSKSYINKPLWFIWLIFFLVYSLSFSYINFNRSSKGNINYLKYFKTIKMVIGDGLKRDFVTLDDIERVKMLIDNK
jgi:hypothetical protein